MSESLLRSDILAFLQANAQGHARAVAKNMKNFPELEEK